MILDAVFDEVLMEVVFLNCDVAEVEIHVITNQLVDKIKKHTRTQTQNPTHTRKHNVQNSQTH